MTTSLFTSESVAIGHPDKVADQISDAILDACLAKDPNARVACETLVSSNLVVVAGEISINATIDYEKIVRETIKKIGYDRQEDAFHWQNCQVLLTLNRQSPDIARGVSEGQGLYREQGAGDQGMMFGYACTETKEYMPLPIQLSHKLTKELLNQRLFGKLAYLRPDGKAQVTVEYDKNLAPIRIHTVVISAQHDANVDYATVCLDLEEMARSILPKNLVDRHTIFYINPTGRFVIGGPQADCGLTGRKIIVDSYGGMGRHGGGAFSGKDPSKVDRSGAYMARYMAKNIVAAGLCSRCEVQLAYAIAVPHPISIKVETFGTSIIEEAAIARGLTRLFNMTPKGIIQTLNLKRPIYKATAFGGHFGREEEEFTWERTDRANALRTEVLGQATPAFLIVEA
ncbi:MAG: methionine adenosyltransferase [Parachlamydiales bacterium]|nr:methionine adenosyltransferase [Parachlamydiales bacterium]